MDSNRVTGLLSASRVLLRACIGLGLAAFEAAAFGVGATQELDLRFVVKEEGRFLGKAVQLQRLDWLLSELELQAENGEWVATRDWVAYLSQGSGRLTTTLSGVPRKKYKAIRLAVGVPKELNHNDPNSWAPDHALHPQYGMHWGWTGGYVFLAVEGRAGGLAFSYHLGNDDNFTRLTLPVVFDAEQTGTLELELDPEVLLQGLLPEGSAAASHSRPGDPSARMLRDNLAHAIRFSRALPDRFHSMSERPMKRPLAAGLRPYPWQLSRRLPIPALPEDNPLSVEGVALGERLFLDQRLSRSGQLSCRSCHDADAAFADGGKAVSVGHEGAVGRRNAMPLFNLAWQTRFFWDGRAKSLREQVLLPIQDPHEMAESMPRVVGKLEKDEQLLRAFERVFGAEGGITPLRIALALEQYLLTLVAQDSRYDRAARGEVKLTELELEGLKLFVTEHDPERGLRGADCFHCHSGTLFTNGQFMANGLPLGEDKGLAEVTQVSRDEGKFKVPSLRNLTLTAPYMHDGSLNSLEDVIEHYDSGVVRHSNLDPNLAKHPAEGLRLTPHEKTALLAFLRSLSPAPSLLSASQY